MSLDWKLTKIKDYENVCWRADKESGGRCLAPVTDALIWATMAVDLGRITAENADDFYRRLHLWEMVAGRSIFNDGEPRFITLDEVKTHIGLSTNVIDRKFPEFVEKAAYVALEKMTGKFFRPDNDNALCGEEHPKTGAVCRKFKHDSYDHHDDPFKRIAWKDPQDPEDLDE